MKEVTAEILAVQHGFTTHEDATMRLNGGDWNSNMDQLEREFEKTNRIIPYQDALVVKEDDKEDEKENEDNKQPDRGKRSGRFRKS